MPTILTAGEIRVRFNERTILDGATLAIEECSRIGLVGRNASGKTTLLKIIAGLMTPDSGEVTRRRDLIVGYLPQDCPLNPKLSVMENVRSGAKHVLDLIAEFESLPAASNRHALLEQRIVALDGWELDHRIETAMGRLNCPDGNREILTLSGGEKRRVALCRAIISQPDLLILDEPTNHLDAESIEWLGEFLKEYRTAFLMVTHDRYFLDSITNCIAELDNGKIFAHNGNYTDYLLAKAERDAGAEMVEHKRQMFLRRELDWVRRGPKARTTKAKGRLDRYFEVADKKAFELEGDMDLVILPPPSLGNRIAELVDVGMELGGKRLFSRLNLAFVGGQKVGITGRNGLGKTTLLKILVGQLQPTEGAVKLGQLTRFNYVDQGRIQISEEKTVLEEISEGGEFLGIGDHKISLRSYLKRFLFTDDRITSQVKYLSGGERSRLLLAKILKNGGNFLILDEPTNDLDLPTLRVLEEALCAFGGVLIVVSHDRYFLDRVCTDILAFEGEGKVTHSVGNYSYYTEKRERAAVASKAWESVARPRIEKIAPADLTKVNPQRARKLSFKETRELEGMEAAILAEEEKIGQIESQFADPDFNRKFGQKIQELNEELQSRKERLAQHYERWQELEAIASSGKIQGV